MTTQTGVAMVVFDLGGVIVRICRSLAEACNAAGLEYHPSVVTDDRAAAWKMLHAKYELGQLGCDAFFDGLAATTDGLYSAAQFRTIHDAWLLGEYPGVRTLIDDIHAAGRTTGVLSNTNPGHWKQLTAPEDFPAIARIQHPHASHLLGLHKPDPGVYRAFELASGAHPGDVIFFDDLPENVDAAAACGWRAVLIDHACDTAKQMRSSLRDLGVL